MGGGKFGIGFYCFVQYLDTFVKLGFVEGLFSLVVIYEGFGRFGGDFPDLFIDILPDLGGSKFQTGFDPPGQPVNDGVDTLLSQPVFLQGKQQVARPGGINPQIYPETPIQQEVATFNNIGDLWMQGPDKRGQLFKAFFPYFGSQLPVEVFLLYQF